LNPDFAFAFAIGTSQWVNDVIFRLLQTRTSNYWICVFNILGAGRKNRNVVPAEADKS
jgi:hypothetical protein